MSTMALRKGMPFSRLRRSLHESKKDPYLHPSEWKPWIKSYEGQVPVCEIEARQEVKQKLEEERPVDEILNELTCDYWCQYQKRFIDIDNVLCSGLLKFFAEYEGEFEIKIERRPMSFNKTLKGSLQTLDSFVSPYYQGKKPNFSKVSKYNVDIVLCGVRDFLILKASEKLSQPSPTSPSRTPRTILHSPTASPTPTQSSSSESSSGSSGSSDEWTLSGSENTPTLETSQDNAEEDILMVQPRKRTRQDFEASIFNSLLQEVQNADDVGRKQRKKIKELRSKVQEQEDIIQDGKASAANAQQLRIQAEQISSLRERLNTLATAMRKKAEKLLKMKADISVELQKAKEETQQWKNEARRLERDREATKKEWKAELATKEAMKKMLVLTGSAYRVKGESIEVAAKAISEGKEPTDALADMVQNGGAGTKN